MTASSTVTDLTIPAITDDMSTLDAALAYASHGWYILPVDPDVDDKHPGSVVGKGWPAQSSRDPEQIIAWFAGTDHVIALHCGRSGAVAFDVDHPTKMPDVLARHCSTSPFQNTRPESFNRGHYLFRQPPDRMLGNSVGRLGGKWGEVRGNNGVIIVAPAGDRRWVRTGPLSPLPAELGEQLPDSTSPEGTASDAQVRAFLNAHQGDERPELIHGWRAAWTKHMTDGDARHPSMVSVLTGALKEARAGFFPAAATEHMLRKLFVEAKTRTPINGETQLTAKAAHAKFDGILAWAVAQALAADLDAVRARTEDKMPTNVTEVIDLDPLTTTDTDTGTKKLKYVGHTAQLMFAHLLGEAFTGKLLHVHGIGWHHWDGTRWAYDDTGAAYRAVYALLKQLWPLAFGGDDDQKELAKAISRCETANGVTGILALAKALPVFAATVADLDADPYLLNLPDGTLDLRTMELRPHDPGDRITKITRAAYHPHKTVGGQTWNKFLTEVLPDTEVRGYLQRTVGLALLGKVIAHHLVIMTGVGSNGKGTFYKAVCWALGDYASTAEPDLFMCRHNAHPTGEMDLLGKRLIVVSESTRDHALDESKMKRLTGGDIIRARRMRQDFIEFEPSHTALLITNHLPKVSGDDEATWRRLRVTPFDVVIPEDERDPHLDEQLQLAADAILEWAVAGWRDYIERGERLDEPDAVLVATREYRRESDAVARFIDDECVTTSAVLKATTAQLYEAFKPWAVADGTPEMSQKAFGQALDRHGYPVTDRTMTGRWRKGIALPAKADDDDA